VRENYTFQIITTADELGHAAILLQSYHHMLNHWCFYCTDKAFGEFCESSFPKQKLKC